MKPNDLGTKSQSTEASYSTPVREGWQQPH